MPTAKAMQGSKPIERPRSSLRDAGLPSMGGLLNEGTGQNRVRFDLIDDAQIAQEWRQRLDHGGGGQGMGIGPAFPFIGAVEDGIGLAGRLVVHEKGNAVP